MRIGQCIPGLAAASLLLLTPMPALAEAVGLPAQDPAVQAAALVAERIAALMYQYDQAAWHATDRMVVGLTQELVPLMRGYVVVPGSGDTLDTIFYGEAGGQLVEMARYSIRGSEVLSGGWLVERPALSLSSMRLVRARDAALEYAGNQEFGLCASASPNVVVLPPDERDVISVYILTPPEEADVYPLGGHYRVSVGPDGEVLDSREFLRTCMMLRSGAAAARQDGAVPQMQVVSHLLDDAPTEIHAFASHYFPLPLLVVTTENHAIWAVTDGAIEYLQQVEEPEPDGDAAV